MSIEERHKELLAELRAINQQLAGVNHLLAIIANQNQQRSAEEERKERSIYDGIDGVRP